MASFGSFETDREIYSGPTYTVYGAKKSGDPTTDYVIKVFSIPRSSFGFEAAEDLDPLISDIERSCAERIALQQKTAASSKFVSVVLETGQDERGVWYATRFYHRSVNKIISGRVALSQAALHHIILSIAQGALDIKRISGRSHGDIQPSVVQMSRSEKVTEAEVVLADPLPGDSTEAETYELSDLRAIGRILLQLVLRREMTDEDVSMLVIPILISPEWTKLFGKDSDRWLSLCNQLLDPNLSLDQLTLEKLVEELEQLRLKPPISQRTILAIAAVGLVLALISALAGWYFGRGHFLITSDPPGAEIRMEVNGKYESKGRTDKAGLRLTLKKGTYKLVAQYPGLPEQTVALSIKGGKEHPHQFSFPYGGLRITTTPANATLELVGADGKKVATTPYEMPVMIPGEYTVSLSAGGHEPAKFSITISSNRQMLVIQTNLQPLRPGDGVIEFTSLPSEATISENGIELGKTPVPKTLPAGLHTITARFEDWRAIIAEVNIAEGDKNPSKHFHFPHGNAAFDIKPEAATIWINGKSIGSARKKRLQPGNHIIRAEHSGYESWTNTITITDGGSIPVTISLKPMLGIVAFTTDPPGAAILDTKAPGKELGRTREGEPWKQTFQPGTYSFVARYDGLDNVSSPPVQVTMGADIPVHFKFTYGTARFDTQPPGADVLLASRKVGSTPYVHRQKPALVPYVVEMADYDSKTGEIDFLPGVTNQVSGPLLPKYVNLVLRSDPPGAQFYLGDALLRGTNDRHTVRWGMNTIRAVYPKLPGLEAQTRLIDVDRKGGTATNFSFPYATVVITNEEREAKLLYQSNVVAGPFPAQIHVKPDVPYDFAIESGSDFRTNLTRITLRRGQLFPLFIKFPERSSYTNSVGMAMVRVKDGFYVGMFEVTELEYQRVMGGAMAAADRMPKVNVPWDDATNFCQRLSALDAASLEKQKLGGWSYSLPIEEEWVRFADPDLTQFTNSVFFRIAPERPLAIDPARKSANRAGIYDLFGNVAEWCYSTTGERVAIGGAHNRSLPKQIPANMMKITDQRSVAEGSPTIGFRCVLKPPR